MSNPASAAAAATARAVSTSIVEQSISSASFAGMREDAVLAEIDRADLRPGRQHRDDDFARGGGFRGRYGRVRPPFAARASTRLRHEVEAGHPMPGLDEIGRHRRPHIAEPDKPDRRHAEFPPVRKPQPSPTKPPPIPSPTSGCTAGERDPACQGWVGEGYDRNEGWLRLRNSNSTLIRSPSWRPTGKLPIS